jgi:hypothetical protein
VVINETEIHSRKMTTVSWLCCLALTRGCAAFTAPLATANRHLPSSPAVLIMREAAPAPACEAGQSMHKAAPADEAGGTLIEYLWPRALLFGVAIMYGTNFPVGRMMNAALPASATTSARFFLAALALSPCLPKLRRDLVGPTLLCGLADSIGYCAQSIALVDTPASKVSFLGALTVVVVPLLSAAFSGRRLDPQTAPQVWIATDCH